MIGKVIMVVGVSGVGKSTFIDTLAMRIDFQRLSAGTLIKQQREYMKQNIDRDELRFSNIEDNQALLIAGFNREKNSKSTLILLDGHIVIDTSSGLQAIPDEVFEKLGINLFLFIEAEPKQIKIQREKDISRDRPSLSTDEIEKHQNRAIEVMKEVSVKIGASYKLVKRNDAHKFTHELLIKY